MHTGETLGKAIGKAIEIKGVKKNEVAKHFGVRPPSVASWIKTGRISKKHIQELFSYFSGVVGPEHWGIPPTSKLLPKGNSSPNLQSMQVPLISWRNLQKIKDGALSIEMLDCNEYVLCPKAHTAHTFALKVAGNSMSSPWGCRTYVEGTLIFVDMGEAKNVGAGNIVVAKIKRTKELLLRELSADGNTLILSALNPAYPPIFDEFCIIGKVIGAWIDS